MLRQILVDVPRTSPDVPLFHQPKVQRCLERLLYIWAIRHPASGYVQGMNDLATPLFVVFLSAALIPASSPLISEPRAGADIPELYASGFCIESRGSKYGGRCELTAAVESLDAQRLPLELLDRVEADTYWWVFWVLIINLSRLYSLQYSILSDRTKLIKRCLTKLLDNIQVCWIWQSPSYALLVDAPQWPL